MFAKINEIGQWMIDIFLLSGRLHQNLPESVKEKLPMFLGLSYEDERRWDRLETKLTLDELKVLYLFLKSLKDYEKNHFRYVIVGIPGDEKVLDNDLGKKPKKIIVKNDCAVDFLKQLAQRIGTDGENVDKVKNEFYLTGTLVKDPFAQKVIAKWRDGVKWFKENILTPLGSADLAGLKNRLLSLNIATTENIQKARKFIQAINAEASKKPKNRGFFGEFWWFFEKK